MPSSVGPTRVPYGANESALMSRAIKDITRRGGLVGGDEGSEFPVAPSDVTARLDGGGGRGCAGGDEKKMDACFEQIGGRPGCVVGDTEDLRLRATFGTVGCLNWPGSRVGELKEKSSWVMLHRECIVRASNFNWTKGVEIHLIGAERLDIATIRDGDPT